MLECVFAIVTKDKTVFSPDGKKNYPELFQELGVPRSECVKIYMSNPNAKKNFDVDKFSYYVEQESVPEWYQKNAKRYEQELRDSVREYVEKNYTIIFGMEWTPIIDDDYRTYYLLNGILETSCFGKTNNYRTSYVRDRLINGELAKRLKKEFGDRLVPIDTNLISVHGERDYGIVEGDILAIPTLGLYEKCKNNIPTLRDAWWLATPQSGARICWDYNAAYICFPNDVSFELTTVWLGVRPYFILKK